MNMSYYDKISTIWMILHALLQKAENVALAAVLAQKISTKDAWFTTFINLQQNSVNAFEISFMQENLCITQWIFLKPAENL